MCIKAAGTSINMNVQFHSRAKKLYLHMFDMVNTAFSYERELNVCLLLYDFLKGKGSSSQLICNAHTAFLL